MSHPYVYGVVQAEDAIELETDAVGGDDRVYPIENGRLAAMVSEVETTDPERTDEDAKRHDEVLREVMEADGGRTVVPMQFGMAFESERALKNVLRGGRPAFRRAMRAIDGAIELGVKVVRDEDGSIDDETVREAIADELEPIATDAVDNGLFSDRLVLNRSYLVERDDREAFDEAVARLEDEYEDLAIQYTGPFAPYSFVDIQIGGQR
ncbi:GvpL/GvpF family gas vesicle protein [Halovivax sp.]|uniref:GvpL/GvpF family gas vesicle protein n=1 Tax=Halovivax sp. TaxID=1935978 RepID=UPI0025B9EAC9|nr:GvpL/GvpF family gas vesicle protein [Halovivax sp.]